MTMTAEFKEYGREEEAAASQGTQYRKSKGNTSKQKEMFSRIRDPQSQL